MIDVIKINPKCFTKINQQFLENSKKIINFIIHRQTD